MLYRDCFLVWTNDYRCFMESIKYSSLADPMNNIFFQYFRITIFIYTNCFPWLYSRGKISPRNYTFFRIIMTISLYLYLISSRSIQQEKQTPSQTFAFILVVKIVWFLGPCVRSHPMLYQLKRSENWCHIKSLMNNT